MHNIILLGHISWYTHSQCSVSDPTWGQCNKLVDPVVGLQRMTTSYEFIYEMGDCM